MRDNTMESSHVIVPIVLFLFAISIGVVLYLATEELLSLVLLIVAGSILPMLVYYEIKFRNPRQIDIQEDGFLAVYRNGKSEFIPWERIRSISFYQGDPTKFGMAAKSGGGYRLKDRGSYALKDQLGKDMREAYARKMGKYPPM